MGERVTLGLEQTRPAARCAAGSGLVRSPGRAAPGNRHLHIRFTRGTNAGEGQEDDRRWSTTAMVERYAKVMPDAYRDEAMAWLAGEPLPAPAAARKPRRKAA